MQDKELQRLVKYLSGQPCGPSAEQWQTLYQRLQQDPGWQQLTPKQRQKLGRLSEDDSLEERERLNIMVTSFAELQNSTLSWDSRLAFWNLLARLNVQKIPLATNMSLDLLAPMAYRAVGLYTTEYTRGTLVRIRRIGYQALNGEILIPAEVEVSLGTPVKWEQAWQQLTPEQQASLSHLLGDWQSLSRSEWPVEQVWFPMLNAWQKAELEGSLPVPATKLKQVLQQLITQAGYRLLPSSRADWPSQPPPGSTQIYHDETPAGAIVGCAAYGLELFEQTLVPPSWLVSKGPCPPEWKLVQQVQTLITTSQIPVDLKQALQDPLQNLQRWANSTTDKRQIKPIFQMINVLDQHACADHNLIQPLQQLLIEFLARQDIVEYPIAPGTPYSSIPYGYFQYPQVVQSSGYESGAVVHVSQRAFYHQATKQILQKAQITVQA